MTNRPPPLPVDNVIPGLRAVGVTPRPGPARLNSQAVDAPIASWPCPPIGLVVGLLPRNQVVRTGERGYGLAVVAIAISGMLTMFMVVAVAYPMFVHAAL